MSTLLKHIKKPSTSEVIKEPLESYPPKPQEYNIIGQIGKGAFASVYVATCKTKKKKVAIKVIELEKDQLDPDDQEKQINFEEIQKEASIMTRMNHNNIVRCLASFAYKTELWLVMPFMEGGSLSDLMKYSEKYKNGLRDEACVATIMRDIISGVAYCHQDGRVHRDIKAANVLLSKEGVAQLSDFGVSGAIIEGGLRKNGRHTFTGSLWWMAPEVLQRENKHSYPADIWSLGITALEIAFGRPPHAKQRPVKVMLIILQQDAPTIQSCINEKDENIQKEYKNVYGKKFASFLKQALQKDPNKRASAKDLLSHSFLKQAKNAEYIIENLVKEAKETKINEKFKPKSVELEEKTNNIDSVDPDNNNNDENKKNDDDFDFSTSGKHSIPQVNVTKSQQKGRFTVATEHIDENDEVEVSNESDAKNNDDNNKQETNIVPNNDNANNKVDNSNNNNNNNNNNIVNNDNVNNNNDNNSNNNNNNNNNIDDSGGNENNVKSVKKGRFDVSEADN